MKRLVLAGVLATGLIFLGGCGGYLAPVMPPSGLLFANVSAPIDTDAEATPMAPKSGSATSYSILGLVAWGDASTTEAARAGSLTKIEQVDYTYLNVLFIFQSFTIHAYGE